MADRSVSDEELRLQATRAGVPWRRFGPYLSDRQWGTVREDYSDDGNAWGYFSHDQARSRAYRWGEDGIAGISDDQQQLCFAISLWNGADPIVKERLFGLTNTEGNHGEDVKEYYFHLDCTPTHSYMKYLYKYPQAAYPYDDLVATNRARTRLQYEYELLDTGIFDEQRYFDVFVEYAKATPEDILVLVTVANRGPEEAPLHVLPTLWFRNTWSWPPDTSRPELDGDTDAGTIRARHDTLGDFELHYDGVDGHDGAGHPPRLLFCENETNARLLWQADNPTPYVKDGITDHLTAGLPTVNPDLVGTKASVDYDVVVPAGGEVRLRLRLHRRAGGTTPGLAPLPATAPFEDFDDIVDQRRSDADEFYAGITPAGVDAERAMVLRQALSGMLWSKQYYYFDLDVWLREHGAHPFAVPRRKGVRNEQWYHMFNSDVISMPDKWEYPWYAAWDLAFHTLALDLVDPDFSRSQLELMLSEVYLHPSGQIPAYEWNFGDVNPPVHAWATLVSAGIARSEHGDDMLPWLREAFNKLLLNFTWWVNRKDPNGNNVFQGGFLGLDNIGIFDRSAPLPTGGQLEQADATAWMAFFCQNMVELALELAQQDPAYEDIVIKFVDHFVWIAAAMDPGSRPDDMWDEEDGFFYDLVRMPDGSGQRLKVRSLVGLLPLCASTVIPASVLDRFPELTARVRTHLERNQELLGNMADPFKPGVGGRRLLAIVNEDKLRRILNRMLDEERFLSPHGIRSISRSHLEDPYVFEVHGERYEVAYEAAESTTSMFGGNSNWRGPVWFPINLLLVRSLLQLYMYYGDDFTVECPTGSGNQCTLFEVAKEIADRLISIFTPDAEGKRPVFGGSAMFQEDPHWHDNLLFYEYFHGDNGAGLGASHQTGWTGVVAVLINLFGHLEPQDLLDDSTPPFARVVRPRVAAPNAGRGDPDVPEADPSLW